MVHKFPQIHPRPERFAVGCLRVDEEIGVGDLLRDLLGGPVEEVYLVAALRSRAQPELLPAVLDSSGLVGRGRCGLPLYSRPRTGRKKN